MKYCDAIIALNHTPEPQRVTISRGDVAVFVFAVSAMQPGSERTVRTHGDATVRRDTGLYIWSVPRSAAIPCRDECDLVIDAASGVSVDLHFSSGD